MAMALTALEAPDSPQPSSPTLTSRSNEYPSVRTLQTWMKEAWDNGEILKPKLDELNDVQASNGFLKQGTIHKDIRISKVVLWERKNG
ncbi:hypothetical protein QFC19_004735 [Naganishia cerealis]|uniref:Uncharacterized protein n=1 Tax=Naganishia cerealis TaxID=610337 RepID=A0ACC2VVJ2_9TREE|nr:hypothetical protein QFC19_004735 [Naganishia cerealis]